MNNRLLIGALISIFLLIGLFLIIKYLKNDKKREIIAIVIDIVGIIVTVITLIVPGIQNITTYNVNNYGENIEVNVGGGANEGDVHLYLYGDIRINREDNGEIVSVNNDAIKTVDRLRSGWGDSSGGRKTYTIKEISEGVLGDNIVFNSIVDTNDSLSPEDKAAGVTLPLTDERNFVGARENSGLNLGKGNVWNGNTIEIEAGKTYLVRLYVHNNSPLAYDAIAKDVSLQFLISDLHRVHQNDISLDGFDSSNGYYGVVVHGFIDSSNANPSSYWDSVKFVSHKPFELKYIPGTASLENNGIGASSKNGPYILSDDIVTEKGVPLGYDVLDGNMPGCYQYAAYVCITVMPVFYE